MFIIDESTGYWAYWDEIGTLQGTAIMTACSTTSLRKNAIMSVHDDDKSDREREKES